MSNIDNYKKLLNSIFNSNETTRDINSVICVYDILDSERLVGVFSSSKACSEFFGTTRGCIDTYITKKRIRTRRFKLERVKL